VLHGELRLAAGLSGRDFAIAAGCQPSKISQIEKAVRPASMAFPVKSTW
jgi:transcriptional regulator with XRE-family HTH domain